MSKRLIDANELISAMYYYEHNEGGLTAYDAQDIINKAPTIEPKRGKWEEKETFHNGGDEPTIEEWQSALCSVCHKYHTTPYMYYFKEYNFCPNCGADMRGKGDE